MLFMGQRPTARVSRRRKRMPLERLHPRDLLPVQQAKPGPLVVKLIVPPVQKMDAPGARLGKPRDHELRTRQRRPVFRIRRHRRELLKLRH
jgi:hypothetical protein